MKIYSVLSLENEPDQVICFEVDDARVAQLRQACIDLDVSEMTIPIPPGYTVQALNKLPQGGPTDGFMSAEDVDRLQQARDFYEEGEVDDLDISQRVLEVLYISRDRYFIELGFSDERWMTYICYFEEIESRA